MSSSKHNQLPDTRTPVYIDILPEFISWLNSSSSSSSRAPPFSRSKSPQVVTAFHPSFNTPRRIRDIDPTVTFISPTVIIGKSSYIVVLDGAPIHNEDTKLECIGPYLTNPIIPSCGSPLLYSTALVPKFWEVLCKSPDPTMYTIIQDVYRQDPAPFGRSSGRPRPVLIFSAKYHFRCSVPIYMHPSSMDPNPAYHANTPFVANVNCTHPNLREPNCSRNRLSTPLNLLGQDSPQSHEDKMQSQLYKQCVPGVNLGNFSLGNSLINNYDSSTATSKEIIAHSSFSSFPKDIRNYIM
ncbi:hypothetical protein BD769DRAFT_972879 [Suillus cothurnatus]|nr:hypothetical protein BD769DRAFT_972879 [Suillus cothurnatus]